MAIDVIVSLEQLRGITLPDIERRTEPYIWPVLLKIDDSTLAGEERDDRVDILVPALGNARIVIKDSMRAGETAAIPASVGIRRARFEDGLHFRQLILIVGLFEMDETPSSAVKAGFRAFFSELGKQISIELFALNDANEEQTKVIMEDITKRVDSRVRSAIEDDLTAWEKTKIFAGTLNLDDFIATDFISLIDENFLVPKKFTLVFEGKEKVLGLEFVSKYEIQGQLRLQPIVVERCQTQIDAVNAAQAVVDDIENEISKLQAQLRGGGDEEQPLPKDFINDEIERLRGELRPAMEALKNARKALQFCRTRQGVREDLQGGGVATAL
jgi:archaellum component FlaC